MAVIAIILDGVRQMWDTVVPVIDSLFVGPMWPATVLVLLVVAYLLLSLLGAVDLQGPDGLEPDATSMLPLEGEGWQSWGAASLRWLNLGEVPIILWLGCFAILQWLIAYGLWTFYESSSYTPTLMESAILALRNAILAAMATKLVTGPLVPYLSLAPNYNEDTLIGQTCVVCSSEATAAFGQAKYNTGAAPLLLNIRTDGTTLKKGDVATIVAYDTQRRLYTVTLESVSLVAHSHETQT